MNKIFFILAMVLAAGFTSAQKTKVKVTPVSEEEMKVREEKNRLRIEREKRDSIEIASLPDSIKSYPVKVFPDAHSVDWIVRGLNDDAFTYKDPSKQTYSRPVYPRKDSTEIKKDQEKVNRIYYTASVSNEAGKSLGKIEFSRPENSRNISREYTATYFGKGEEYNAKIPDEILNKIKQELKEQAEEEISSIEFIDYANANRTTDVYAGDKEKTYTGKTVQLEDKMFYWVWGTKNGTTTNGSYLFRMNGEYVPSYEHDSCCNRKIKFAEK